MSVLFGHPTGNPNSHHAALAYWEAGLLEAFCVPWVPQKWELDLLRGMPGVKDWVARLERRSAPELLELPKKEGRSGEWWRMLRRLNGAGTEILAHEANEWLMEKLARECGRPRVHAVHSYEDCALKAFQRARSLGKACVYELPIAYHREWEERRRRLEQDFADWLPESGAGPSGSLTPASQKDLELELADLVLAPSGFVRRSVERFMDRKVVVVPYGVDLCFWGQQDAAPRESLENRPLRFVYAGHASLRKGVPLMLDAWRCAGLRNAELELLGPWQLSGKKLRALPAGVSWKGPVSRGELRRRYQQSDVFVFSSCFEGFGLVILEAMAAGLPVIATDATAAPEVMDSDCGQVVSSGSVDALVAAFRWAGENRGRMGEMGVAARKRAEQFGWSRYRRKLSDAVTQFCHG